MSLLNKAKQHARELRRSWSYRDMHSVARSAENGRKPLAVVFGNCQALPLSVLLRDESDLSENFRIVQVPPVHVISASEVPTLHRVLSKADILVAQEIRDGYRDLEIGTDQLRAVLSDRCKVVTYPVLYYEGLFPYQVYVRHRGHTSEEAPLTGYTDLRFIYAASRGWQLREATEWLGTFRAPQGVIEERAQASLAELTRREADLSTEGAARDIARYELSDKLFHTVNHPSNKLLRLQASAILAQLGLPTVLDAKPRDEFLGSIRAPVEPEVCQQLNLDLAPTKSWTIDGRSVEVERVLDAHLAWFRARPEVLESGLSQHSGRLRSLGLTP